MVYEYEIANDTAVAKVKNKLDITTQIIIFAIFLFPLNIPHLLYI